jgi:hypothetical protein
MALEIYCCLLIQSFDMQKGQHDTSCSQHLMQADSAGHGAEQGSECWCVQVSEALRQRQQSALECTTTATLADSGAECHTSGLTGVQACLPRALLFLVLPSSC